MLFLKLKFCDFLSFKGENTIAFPDPREQDTSLVLVLAPNNGGKTNVIRALRFLFYGDLLGHTNAPQRLIHDGARQAKERGTVEGWVQATALIHGEPVTFRRRIEASLRGGEGRDQAKVTLEKFIENRQRLSFLPDKEGVLQDLLHRLVPRSLFDYFYFQGEELARQLLRGSRRGQIREGLETLLHEDSWKEIHR